MPLHDWTRVPSGLFHHFQQSCSIRIADALNSGILPAGVSALVEQRTGPHEPDVLAIESPSASRIDMDVGGVATAMDPPKARIVQRTDQDVYAGRANRITIRHHLGHIIAVIEIVSPGNKDSRGALRGFVEKTAEFIRGGIHALIVDLFPPTPRDPHGIHKAIWNEITEEEFTFPAGKDRTLVSYEAGRERVAYIEPLAVGDEFPDMPLFLCREMYVRVPLESTYVATWQASPTDMRKAVETGRLPGAE